MPTFWPRIPEVKTSPQNVRWLNRQLERAQHGRVTWVSRVLQEVIPFNRPHRLKIVSLGPNQCVVSLPWRRRNLNHLRTMHACALATAAEYASGLCILSLFGVGGVRLIMSDLHMHYSRRAESACLATASISESQQEGIQEALNRDGRASLLLHSTVRDSSGDVVAEADIEWHLKVL